MLVSSSRHRINNHCLDQKFLQLTHMQMSLSLNPSLASTSEKGGMAERSPEPVVANGGVCNAGKSNTIESLDSVRAAFSCPVHMRDCEGGNTGYGDGWIGGWLKKGSKCQHNKGKRGSTVTSGARGEGNSVVRKYESVRYQGSKGPGCMYHSHTCSNAGERSTPREESGSNEGFCKASLARSSSTSRANTNGDPAVEHVLDNIDEDVRGELDNFADSAEKILGKPWIWSMDRLEVILVALEGVSARIFRKN